MITINCDIVYYITYLSEVSSHFAKVKAKTNILMLLLNVLM